MTRRVALRVFGSVQGVGFRPFIYRLAHDCRITGFVTNSPDGVVIEAEGSEDAVDSFCRDLPKKAPHHSTITGMEKKNIEPLDDRAFVIKPSVLKGAATALVLPDLATCPECLEDVRDPHNRRYRYAFTNCTYCGPRYSIIDQLPYDRARTTMRGFPMCDDCRQEFENPLDRRFHAQPTACPACGPKPWFCDGSGRISHQHVQALEAAAELVRDGGILAVKGLAGFQLMCLADNDRVIRTLRGRKHRPTKPLAVMCKDLDAAGALAEINAHEAALLAGAASPIVLLRNRGTLPQSIAPDNAWLGIMLPTTPLHHLLLDLIDAPVVATSGNLSDEPLCYENGEALDRLGSIADAFLMHDRPVLNPADDSVAMVIDGKTVLVRRARGYAPSPLPSPDNRARFAFGPDLKNTFARSRGNQVFMSPHHGDMDNVETHRFYQRNRQRYATWFPLENEPLACRDLHPDYQSTQLAEREGVGRGVQHHVAHMFACAGEYRLRPPFMGIIWDGTGYGPDGTIWGGEFLLADKQVVQRVGHLDTFPLPGGEKAVKEPLRVAAGLLYRLYGNDPEQCSRLLPTMEPKTMAMMLTLCEKEFNTPLTSSAGRLFDGVAALCGFVGSQTHEGMAAIWLEARAHQAPKRIDPLPYTIENRAGMLVLDWRPMVKAIIADCQNNIAVPVLAARFHRTMIKAALEIAHRIGCPKVLLGGGCFQNRILYGRMLRQLNDEGFQAFAPREAPPGDGGIAYGQIWAMDTPLIHPQNYGAPTVGSEKE